MTVPIIPLAALAALVLLTVYKALIQPLLLSPLRQIPSAHWSAPLSPFWILWTRFKSRENTTVYAAHMKYGPVVRLAPNELSVNDLGALKTVYAGGWEKGEWYVFFDNFDGAANMFSSPLSRPHSARKRMVSNIYSRSTLHSSPILAQQTHTLLFSRLLPIISSSVGKPIDIHEIWMSATMDSITAYLFGLASSSNFLQDEDYRRHWLKLYHGRHIYPFFPQELPRLTAFLQKFGINLVPKWVAAANAELEEWARSMCTAATLYLQSTPASKRAQNPGDEPVVLSTMLQGIQKEENTKGEQSPVFHTLLKNKELGIASEMIDELAAGHETSGITLTYISHFLSQNIALQNTLRAELRTLSSNMVLSSDGSVKNELPNPKELDALPLLHAIVMETLRLRGAIPGGQPRMSPHPTSTLGPYTIPGGVRVAAQAYSLHRNEDVFPEPEKWDCERWMDDRNGSTEETRRDRDRYFWAFSSGGRMCIGSHFAMHEMKLVIAAVYLNFTSYIVDDEGIEQEDAYIGGPIGNKLTLRFERAG